MADDDTKAPEAAAQTDAKTDAQDSVDLIATGSFYEQPNMTGKLLQNGDTFSTTRDRAVELRANGLVRYSDAKTEETAAKDDLPPADNMGTPTITSRSIRRPVIR